MTTTTITAILPESAGKRRPPALIIKVLPPGFSPERAADLLTEYQLHRACPTPAPPPGWYVETMIAEFEAIVAGTAVQR